MGSLDLSNTLQDSWLYHYRKLQILHLKRSSKHNSINIIICILVSANFHTKLTAAACLPINDNARSIITISVRNTWPDHLGIMVLPAKSSS